MKKSLGIQGSSDLLQVHTLGSKTRQGTFTDEKAKNGVLHANADLTLTVKFNDGTVDLVIDILAGDDFGFDSTVATITTTASAILS